MTPDALLRHALTDYAQGKLQDSIEKLKKCLALSPRFEDAFESLSVIYYNEKKYDDAISVLKKWIQLNPNSIMAHTNLSRCYVAKDMILEAEREQNEARRLTWKQDLKDKKQAIPKTDAKKLIERYKKVIEIDPKDVLGYFSLANTYLEAGIKRDAADTFEKAISVNPNHSSSYLGLGQALTELGDKVKAKKIYEQGIKVAAANGDMMTQKKMEAHLRGLSRHGDA